MFELYIFITAFCTGSFFGGGLVYIILKGKLMGNQE